MCDIFASHADDYWAAGKLELRYTYLLHGVSLALEKAIVPGYVAKSVEISDLAPYDDAEEIARARRPRRGASLLVIPQDGSFNFLMAKSESKMISIPQHLLLNVLAKRAGKSELYKKAGQCKWDAKDLKIAEKGVCVAEDLVETIAPYARAHAEKLAQAVSRE